MRPMCPERDHLLAEYDSALKEYTAAVNKAVPRDADRRAYLESARARMDSRRTTVWQHCAEHACDHEYVERGRRMTDGLEKRSRSDGIGLPDIRSAESAEMAGKTRVREHIAERKSRTEDARRQFVEKFNALVLAVEAFSNKYNEQVWPTKEAETLRKAMVAFQKASKLYRPTPGIQKANAK